MSAPNEWRGEVLLEFALRLVQALCWPKPGYWFVTERERVQVLAEKEYCVRFEGEQGEIVIVNGTWKIGRVTIRGDFPRDNRGHYFGPGYGDQKFEVTVSGERSIESVARDIERRLLREFLPAWTEAEKQRLESASWHQKALAQARDLAIGFGESPPEEHKESWSFWKNSISAEGRGPDYIKVTAEHLSLEKTKKVLRLLGIG